MTASSLTDALSPSRSRKPPFAPPFANISRVRLQGDVLEVFVRLRNLQIQAELIQFSLLHPCPLQPVNVVCVQGSQAEAVCVGPSCNLWHMRESGVAGDTPQLN